MWNVFAVIGIVTVFLVLAAVVLWVWNYIDYRYRLVKERNERHVWEFHREQIMSKVFADGFWLSEHPPTMNLVQRIAVGEKGISELRDDWRRECREWEANNTKAE